MTSTNVSRHTSVATTSRFSERKAVGAPSGPVTRGRKRSIRWTLGAVASAVLWLGGSWIPFAGSVSPAAATTVASTHGSSGTTGSVRYGLAPGQMLLPGQRLTLGSYALTMQTDGNLVATDDGWPIWQTGTSGHPRAFATMTKSGSLLVESHQQQTLWSTDSYGRGTCLLGGVDSFLPTGHLAYHMLVDTPGDSFAWWPLWSLAPCYIGHGTKVAIVGDSVAALVSEVLPSLPDRYYAFNISAFPGFPMAAEVPNEEAVLNNPAGQAKDLIMNLGTIDSNHYDTQWRTGFHEVVKAAGKRCTILVTVSSKADQNSSIQPDDIALHINSEMKAWAATHSNFHVLPWNALLHQGNHYQEWISSDGFHPNAAGEAELGSLYFSYLKSDCGI